MESEKYRERSIRETAECIYQNYPPVCRMVIRFLTYKKRKVSGYVKSVYYDERIFYFCGLDHLLLLMEDIMDTADYPQTTVDYRNIKGESFRQQTEIFMKDGVQNIVSLFEDEEITEINLEKKAVSVQVITRRNCSIQGELCIGPKTRVFFRSGVELMRMLYEYLETTYGGKMTDIKIGNKSDII